MGLSQMINLNRANLSIDPLNAAINERIEQASLIKHANDVPRDYLGASLIGETCLRKIQFEWMTASKFSARVRSIFARGHYFEAESRQQLLEAGFVFAPTKRSGLSSLTVRSPVMPTASSHPFPMISIWRRRRCGNARGSTPRTSKRSSATAWPKSFRAMQARSRSIRAFSTCSIRR